MCRSSFGFAQREWKILDQPLGAFAGFYDGRLFNSPAWVSPLLWDLNR
jgi:hypothetical protein